jgi:metallophosphoesterase (TIGR00282 family)
MPGPRLLFLGDIVGKPGRNAVLDRLAALREHYAPDVIVANAENASGGLGIVPKNARQLLDGGIDVLTTGNHVYQHKEVYPYLDLEERVLRPANYLESNPGHGYTFIERAGVRWAVLNLAGTVFLQNAQSPFLVADRLLARLRNEADLIVLDFHAEATSEKVAMGWHLDGRVTAVLGTHTHVPTADARVLPGGSAYISDVGMTGSRASVIGVKVDQILERFKTQMPVKFETAGEDVWIMGCVVEAREDGLAKSIEPVMEAT